MHFFRVQVLAKRCGHRPNKQVVPAEEMLARLQAAKRGATDIVVLTRPKRRLTSDPGEEHGRSSGIRERPHVGWVPGKLRGRRDAPFAHPGHGADRRPRHRGHRRRDRPREDVCGDGRRTPSYTINYMRPSTHMRSQTYCHTHAHIRYQQT